MNDIVNYDNYIIREFSCRLCLCTDIIKLKPLSGEIKRKLKKLFNITIRLDDHLPKAICHDCLQQVSGLYFYTIKVAKNQKFLKHHEAKNISQGPIESPPNEKLIMHTSIPNIPTPKVKEESKELQKKALKKAKNTNAEQQHGDGKDTPSRKEIKPQPVKYLEAIPLEEFAEIENVDKSLLFIKSLTNLNKNRSKHAKSDSQTEKESVDSDILDPIVLIEGKPAKHGADLDKQITLFYQMKCFICLEEEFNFRSLMKHYKEKHGVPGYVTCCGKKFHYFYLKKITEHMAYHLQPNIFMCTSCNQNFQTSHELVDHRNNGGRSEGKVVCPRCSERYATYHELGLHILAHRTDAKQCDYCGKMLKHHHHKKTLNHMENLILCSQCVRTLKNIEKQEKENKEKIKASDTNIPRKHHKIRQATGSEISDLL